jgi:hypothetical protein
MTYHIQIINTSSCAIKARVAFPTPDLNTVSSVTEQPLQVIPTAPSLIQMKARSRSPPILLSVILAFLSILSIRGVYWRELGGGGMSDQ